MTMLYANPKDPETGKGSGSPLLLLAGPREGDTGHGDGRQDNNALMMCLLADPQERDGETGGKKTK